MSAASAVRRVALALDNYVPWYVTMPIAVIGGGGFSALLWAFIPALLQAKRGSHIVITTIMFNYIAAAADGLSAGACADRAGQDGAGNPHLPGRRPAPEARLAAWRRSESKLGAAPLNVSFLHRAVRRLVRVWVLVWRSKLGFDMRTLGVSPTRCRLCRHRPMRAPSSSPCCSRARSPA